MKQLFIIFFLSLNMMNTKAQTSIIKTSLGEIAVHLHTANSAEIPIVFLHGVYFDHHLWDNQVEFIKNRSVICLDMPLHGQSQENIKAAWTLDDGANMLLEILDSLKIPKVIAVGHSWGSMTILRAAHKKPEKFASIGLCNMPFKAASNKEKRKFNLQHSLLFFRSFYTKQAAKALYGKATLKNNPSLLLQLKRPMDILSNKTVKYIDKIVILDADDATEIIKNLKVNAIALKGESDYVPTPPKIETLIVQGGHVSPLESPNEVNKLIERLIKMQQ